MITDEEARAILSYSPETGVFIWAAKINRYISIGEVAGSLNYQGYVTIMIRGRNYRAHRLAWLLMTGNWPKHQIDHVNGVRDDNRFSNLREATNSQNNRNRIKQANNTSGFKGVSFHNQMKRWRSSIMANGMSKHLGLFDTREEAYSAYCAAADNLHGEFIPSSSWGSKLPRQEAGVGFDILETESGRKRK